MNQYEIRIEHTVTAVETHVVGASSQQEAAMRLGMLIGEPTSPFDCVVADNIEISDHTLIVRKPTRLADVHEGVAEDEPTEPEPGEEQPPEADPEPEETPEPDPEAEA